MKAVIMGQLLDSLGNECIGGAERYAKELALVIAHQGWDVIIFQKACSGFETEIAAGIKVIGVPSPTRVYGNLLFNHRVTKALASVPPDLVIYVDMLYALPHMFRRSIGIQHGIYWDTPNYNCVERAVHGHAIARIASRLDRVIAVDTNFINWLRTEHPRIGQHSCVEYIPNFTALSRTSGVNAVLDGVPLNKPTTIVFPRRFESNRGTAILFEAATEIVRRGYSVEFHFVGTGSLEDWLRTSIERSGLEQVIKVYSSPPHLMGSVYERSDIVVIPSVGGEGTSLSCIEAMGFGKPVVATTVGGLCDLVMHGFNGLLVAPTEHALVTAITHLLDNPEQRAAMGRNALAMAATLSRQEWAKRVLRVIRDVMEQD